MSQNSHRNGQPSRVLHGHSVVGQQVEQVEARDRRGGDFGLVAAGAKYARRFSRRELRQPVFADMIEKRGDRDLAFVENEIVRSGGLCVLGNGGDVRSTDGDRLTAASWHS